MAGKTIINGTARDTIGGKVLIDGVSRDINGGKTNINGTLYDIPFGPVPPAYEQVDYIENTSGIESIVSPITFKKNLRIETTLYRSPDYTDHGGVTYCGLHSQNHYFKFAVDYEWNSDDGEYAGRCHFCYSGGSLLEPELIIENGTNLKLFVAEPQVYPFMQWNTRRHEGSKVPSGMSSYDDSVIRIFEYQTGTASSPATPRPTIGGFGKISAYVGASSTTPEIELYPCIRRSDNQPGFYEPTLRTFYTCSGLSGVTLT